MHAVLALRAYRAAVCIGTCTLCSETGNWCTGTALPVAVRAGGATARKRYQFNPFPDPTARAPETGVSVSIDTCSEAASEHTSRRMHGPRFDLLESPPADLRRNTLDTEHERRPGSTPPEPVTREPKDVRASDDHEDVRTPPAGPSTELTTVIHRRIESAPPLFYFPAQPHSWDLVVQPVGECSCFLSPPP